MQKQVLIFLILLGIMSNLHGAQYDVESIRSARLEQNSAIEAGNIEVAAKYWTDDVTLRRGLGDSVIGKDAYFALMNVKQSDNKIIYVRIPDLIEVSSDWPLAYESGIWRAFRNSDGSDVISGRYSAQWVKRDGRWLIRSEVFVALTCHEKDCPFKAVP